MGQCYSSEKVSLQLFTESEKTKESADFEKLLRYKPLPEIKKEYKFLKKLSKNRPYSTFLVQKKNQNIVLRSFKKSNYSFQQIKEFMRQRKQFKQLNSEKIVKSYDNFQNSNRYFFESEYIKRGSLLKIMKQNLSFTEQEVRVIAAQILQAIFFLHSRGIVYNNLQCKNIFVDDFGLLKLNDFSFVDDGNSMLENTLSASLCYIPPERKQKDFNIYKADFWALGIILYFLWYREYPFNQISASFINKLDQNQIFKDKNKSIPKSLKKFIQALLNPNQEKRLGNSFKEIKRHSFFNKFDWEGFEKDPTQFTYVNSMMNTSSEESIEQEDKEIFNQQKTIDYQQIKKFLQTEQPEKLNKSEESKLNFEKSFTSAKSL